MISTEKIEQAKLNLIEIGVKSGDLTSWEAADLRAAPMSQEVASRLAPVTRKVFAIALKRALDEGRISQAEFNEAPVLDHQSQERVDLLRIIKERRASDFRAHDWPIEYPEIEETGDDTQLKKTLDEYPVEVAEEPEPDLTVSSEVVDEESHLPWWAY